jgi:hypothetical protein
MPKVLLFVHGTGVRGKRFSETVKLISRQLDAQKVPAAVRGCFWGDAVGARLRADGRSIPLYEDTGGEAPSEADQLLALWSVLYTDPWYELRLLRHRPAKGMTTLGEDPPSAALRTAVQEFEPSGALLADLADCGLDRHFATALTAIRTAAEFEQAAATAAADPLDHRRAVARALIAHAMVDAAESGQPPIDGEPRDRLTERLTDELHGYGMGVGDFFLAPMKGIAKRAVTRKLVRGRGALTDDAAPLAGDVLRFLARGDEARMYLSRAIGDIDGDVYLLGHSLGGIMCADLLARAAMPKVKGLITVGSQAPFLYEIGALPALDHPDPLPGYFPPWLNLYDRQDPLSYVGSAVFGEHVTDIEVDNGQPFPESHGAYFSNRSVWTAVAAFLS